MDRLAEKSYRTYDYISRYTSFPYYYDVDNKKYIYGTTSQLDDSNTYTLYKVVKNDTYDSIALKFYNSPTLFWVICDFNKVQDPYTSPKVDTYVKVPTLSTIKFE